MYSSTWPMDADQRVGPVRLAPGEPATELVGVQLVRVTGLPVEIGDSRQVGRRHRVTLERQQDGIRMGGLPGPGEDAPAADRRTHGEAPCLKLGRRPARLAAV